MTESDLKTDFTSPETAHLHAQRQALKWPMIALFGIPMVILAAGLLMFWLASNLQKTMPQTGSEKAASASAATTDSVPAAPITTTPLVAAAPTPLASPIVATSDTTISALTARVDRLEAQTRDTQQAVAITFVTHNLREASKGSKPFQSELSAAETALGGDATLVRLRPLAEKGVATRTDLALSFPKAAAKAYAAAPKGSESKGIVDSIAKAFGAIFTVRRLDDPDSTSVAAIIHRAELAVNAGDIEGAMTHLKALPLSSQAAMDDWLKAATARILVDQTINILNEQALSRLGKSSTPLSGVTGG